jgi:ketosteroid isomerase-like protein
VRVAAEESELLKGFRADWEEGNRAWNEGDFRRAYAGLPDDFEYRLASAWPNAKPLRGPQEIAAFFEDYLETFPDVRSEPLIEMTQTGPQTIVVGFHVAGSGRSSGAFTTMEIWQVWRFDHGRPSHLIEYADRKAALQAASEES